MKNKMNREEAVRIKGKEMKRKGKTSLSSLDWRGGRSTEPRFWPALRKKPVAIAANVAAGRIRRATTQKQCKQVVLCRFCFVVYKNISENIGRSRDGTRIYRIRNILHTLYMYVHTTYIYIVLCIWAGCAAIHMRTRHLWHFCCVVGFLLMFSVALPLYFCPLYFSGVIPVLCSASGVQVEVQTTSKSQTRRLR